MIIIIILIRSSSINSVSNLPSNSFEYMNNLAINPVVIIVLVIVIVIYFAIFSSVNKNDGEVKSEMYF